MRKLAVTVVCGHGVLGGAEAWLLRLLDATSRVSVDAVVLQDGPLVDELRRRGIAVDVVPVGNQPWHLPAPTARLAARLRAGDADVVLANGVKAAMVAVPAARLAGVPVVWAKHDHMYDDVVARPLGRLADGVVGPVEELVDPTGRADAALVPVPPPEAPPAPRDEARAFWAAHGVPDGPDLLLGMVGRLVPYKGVDDAVRALARPAAEGWRLVVVGDDDPAAVGESERLSALARELGVGDRVAFTGAVAGASRWLAGFDALAVLTKPGGRRTPPREGFGTSAFEAMLAGVPVVAVEGGAVVRRLAGRAGFGVPAADPDAVARALGALRDPATRRAAGEAGRELVADFPDAPTCAERLVAFLSQVARRPGAGAHGGPSVSVVTTVRNEADGIERLLDAVVGQFRPGDEVVIVDGGSTDGTVQRIKEWAARAPGDAGDAVTVVEAPGAGISEGRNIAVRAARHPHVACTDAGCLPQADWLDALRAGFVDDPAPDLVTGLYDVAARTPMEEALAVACYPRVEDARRTGPWARAYGRLLGRTFDPTLPTGRSMAFTRRTFEAVGGFPEGLATAEDVGFGRAVAATGGRAVLAADAVVRWYQRDDLADTARMFHAYGVGDGRSGDRLLVGRNVARLAAYGLAPVLWLVGGGRTRAAVAAAAGVYLSVPAAAAHRRRLSWRARALLPVALAVKDVAKAIGCLRGSRDPYHGQP